jgi:hypothetical protein
LVPDLQKALLEIGAAGPVFAKQRTIAERIPKDAEPIEPAADMPPLAAPTPHAGKTQQPSGEQSQAFWFRNCRRNLDIRDELLRRHTGSVQETCE